MNTDPLKGSTNFNRSEQSRSTGVQKQQHTESEVMQKIADYLSVEAKDLKPSSLEKRDVKYADSRKKSLLVAIEKLSKKEKLATPFHGESSINATDVYLLKTKKQNFFYKPLKTDVDAAALGYDVSCVLGLEKAIPPAVPMVLSKIVASNDEEQKYLTLKNKDGEKVLVNRDYAIPLKKNESLEDFSFSDDFDDIKFDSALSSPQSDSKDSAYTSDGIGLSESEFDYSGYSDDDYSDYSDDDEEILSDDEGVDFSNFDIPKKAECLGFTLYLDQDEGEIRVAMNKLKESKNPTDRQEDFLNVLEGDPVLEVVTSLNGEEAFLCPPALQEKFDENGGVRTLEREGVRFEVVEDDDGAYSVIRRNVVGTAQSAVPNLFDSGGLDIRSDSPKATEIKKEFYDRVDFDAFVDSFLMTIITRPEDGKIEVIEDANYLFEMLDPEDPNSSLACRMIDLEDSFPENSHRNTFFDKTVCATKTGLMGFPHARMDLTQEQRERIEEKINIVLASSEAAMEIIRKSGLSEEKVAASLEVFDSLYEFMTEKKGSEVSLEDLFFHVFPEYEEQWNLLDKILGPISPELKASKIGNESLEDWLETYRYEMKEEDAPLNWALMKKN